MAIGVIMNMATNTIDMIIMAFNAFLNLAQSWNDLLILLFLPVRNNSDMLFLSYLIYSLSQYLQPKQIGNSTYSFVSVSCPHLTHFLYISNLFTNPTYNCLFLQSGHFWYLSDLPILLNQFPHISQIIFYLPWTLINHPQSL